jgi:iron complex transport system substrate-binding protein
VFTDALGHNISVDSISVANAGRVVALSESFADVWQLSGGSLAAVTEDALDGGVDLPEGVASVGDLIHPSLESIIALNPDLVLLSADISGHKDLYENLRAAGVTAVYFSVESFEDYLDMLKICTDITGRSDLYRQNGLDIKTKIGEMTARARKTPPPPRILLLRANSSKVQARNSHTMAGTMLKDLSCVNIADGDAGLLDNLSMEIIIQEDPDFIFTVFQGESEEKARKSLEDALLSNPAWASLSAVQNTRYVTLPKDLFHLKPNNRWDEAYEILWEILYGES